MAEELAGLDRITESLRLPIRQYAGLVRDIAGPNAGALTLFGPVVAGVFDPKRHAVKSVLVLKAVDLPILRRLAEHGAKLGKARISAPLIMTPEYIKASLDTFPLELLEIQQQHLNLFGEDHFGDLTFDEAHIRLQCERELKVVLIGLRQGLLAATGKEKFLGGLEMNLGEALMRTLRGLLLLKGQRQAKPAVAVIAEVEKITERKLLGVRQALDASATHGWSEFESLYRDVEALGELADAW
ncbi:MAG: hypothetical protein ACYSUI_03085 [Planctomycetota bacterium]|jgi:hypothetical protein